MITNHQLWTELKETRQRLREAYLVHFMTIQDQYRFGRGAIEAAMITIDYWRTRALEAERINQERIINQ